MARNFTIPIVKRKYDSRLKFTWAYQVLLIWQYDSSPTAYTILVKNPTSFDNDVFLGLGMGDR